MSSVHWKKLFIVKNKDLNILATRLNAVKIFEAEMCLSRTLKERLRLSTSGEFILGLAHTSVGPINGHYDRVVGGLAHR